MTRRLTTPCFIILFFLCLSNGGCAITPPQKKLQEDINVYPKPEEQQTRNTGSLWQDGGQLGSLFVTEKARRVGDIVTVKIVESSKGANEATTKSGRDSSIEGQVENFFGVENTKIASKTVNPFGSVKGGLQSDFDGQGKTARSGSVSAYITARVSEALPNGNLKITGSRDVSVNGENQYITLSGIIRTKDLTSDNIILSTYIADARISYSGKGVVDDRQHPGWMARILDRVFPF